jgi:[acyl-carrier-protein] S-malonyltransferase
MKKSVTLLFPGQGSQYVGMGQNLAPELAKLANENLGFDLQQLMLEGPEEDLKMTANTQPAILTHSIGLFYKLKPILEKYNVTIDRVLGHSVGEYAALVAAGALRFEDAVKAVNLRGKYMQEAVPAGMGKMIALMKVPQETINELCQACSTDQESVMPANFNEPNQTVISGHASACDRALVWLEKNMSETYRAVELNVSAPFHSSLMKPAALKLIEHLKTIEMMNTIHPYVANIDAKEYPVGTKGSTVLENLYQQVDGPVKWSQSISALPDDTLCLEVGPGRVLMGLSRKINRDHQVISLDKEGSFAELEELLS